MLGFQIAINDTKIFVGVRSGSTTINVTVKEGISCVNISGINHVEQAHYSWYDAKIELGDEVDIKFVEIDHVTLPEYTNKDKTIKPPKTKLEFFKELEANLKKRKLI